MVLVSHITSFSSSRIIHVLRISHGTYIMNNILINRYRLDYIKVSVQQIICMMRSAIYQDIFIDFFLMHNSHTQLPHIDRRSAREPSFLHIMLLNDFFILFIKLFSIRVILF